MSDAKPLSAGATLARLLNVTQAQTEKSAKSCPPERRMKRLAPGKATPLWLLGHMANAADFIGNYIGFGAYSGAMPQEWAGKFTPTEFGGKPITDNPADYPSWDEVAAAYAKAMSALAAHAAKATDAELLGDPKSPMPPPLKTVVSTLQDCVTLNIVHDSHHRGQLAMLANAKD